MARKQSKTRRGLGRDRSVWRHALMAALGTAAVIGTIYGSSSLSAQPQVRADGEWSVRQRAHRLRELRRRSENAVRRDSLPQGVPDLPTILPRVDAGADPGAADTPPPLESITTDLFRRP